MATTLVVAPPAVRGASSRRPSRESVKEALEADPGATRGNPFPSPDGLFLRGSHGYGIQILAQAEEGKESGRLYVTIRGRTGEVDYLVPANFAGEGIRANLGPFGRVDMKWVPSGGVDEVTARCHRRRRREFYARGAYVGTLRIHGGGGFTTVSARRVAWRRSWYAHASICRLRIQEGTPGPGEHLEAGAKGTQKLWQSPTSLDMVQEKRGVPIAYEARQDEQAGKVKLERVAWASAGGRTLDFKPDFSVAEIHPPAPFSGRARFEKTKGWRGSWLGDLRVDFPDRSGVPLAGKSFEASFESYFHVVHEE
ncbi:MAG TPA: hypothetical protein VHB53_03980 [Solirubrobacterales bacterium]|nr:hypothetical protein [Solirubrobacterales bacterium]